MDGTVSSALNLWEAATGRWLREFGDSVEVLCYGCLSGDGLYALSKDGKSMKVWEISTGKLVRKFEGKTYSDFASCFLSRDRRYALSGGWDKTLKYWEVATGNCLRTFEGHTSGVTSVFLSGDGRYALSGSMDKTLKFWEVATAECLRTFGGHTDEVTSVFLRGDGRYALSGSEDKTLKFWEVATAKCLRTLEGHTRGVCSIVLSGDGRYALSGSWDKTIKFWDVATGKCLRTIEGYSVFMSEDGRFAVSVGDRDTVHFWTLDWELEDKRMADWDEGARPYVEVFLTQQTPHAGSLPAHRQPTDDEVTLALTRRGRPTWNEAEFQRLLHTLECVGFGWLRPEGVRDELEKMAGNWQSPPPVVGLASAQTAMPPLSSCLVFCPQCTAVLASPDQIGVQNCMHCGWSSGTS